MNEWAPLIDVNNMTLEELLAVVDGPILDATQRVIEDLKDPNSVSCGFSSTVSNS